LLDGGGDVQTARFRSLLSQLTEKFVESEKEISDMTVKAQDLMKKEGIAESLVSIMEGMNQIFAAKVANQEYKQYVAAYVTLRSQGQSHDQAVSGLRALIGSLR
jgi:hypothetical protein